MNQDAKSILLRLFICIATALVFEGLVNCYRTFKKGAWKDLERVGLDVKKDRD